MASTSKDEQSLTTAKLLNANSTVQNSIASADGGHGQVASPESQVPFDTDAVIGENDGAHSAPAATPWPKKSKSKLKRTQSKRSRSRKGGGSKPGAAKNIAASIDATDNTALSIASQDDPAGLATGNLYSVDIGTIQIGTRLRELDEEALATLQESLALRGQLHPILVRLEAGRDGPQLVLVAGLHRLIGGQRLGWQKILCRVVEASEVERELIEIDENFARVPLSAAAEALSLGRRFELYERLYGPAQARGAHAANAVMGRANAAATLAPAFATATAAITGAAERTVQRGVARATALGVDLLKRIVGTCLDLGTELDALAKLTPAARDKLIERAATGKVVSAAAVLKKSAQVKSTSAAGKTEPEKSVGVAEETKLVEIEWDLRPLHDNPIDRHADENGGALKALQDAWLQAPASVKKLFLAWLASTGSLSPEAKH
jgi:hypothetical protein